MKNKDKIKYNLYLQLFLPRHLTQGYNQSQWPKYSKNRQFTHFWVLQSISEKPARWVAIQMFPELSEWEHVTTSHHTSLCHLKADCYESIWWERNVPSSEVSCDGGCYTAVATSSASPRPPPPVLWVTRTVIMTHRDTRDNIYNC